MAIARCDKHGEPQGMKLRYPHAHTPHAKAEILCGAPNCTRPALVWLSDKEEGHYRKGTRSFPVISYYQVRVE